MIKPNIKTSDSKDYFAETHPFIHKRLMPIMLIITAAMFFAAMIGLFFAVQSPRDVMPAGAYWIQWFNVFALLATVVAMGVGILQLRKNKIHQAITILLVSGAVSLIAQCVANGGIGEASIVAYPGVVMISGFFGNLIIMQRIKRLLVLSIIGMY